MNRFMGPLFLILLSPVLFVLNLPAFTVWNSATASASLMLAAILSLVAGLAWGIRNALR